MQKRTGYGREVWELDSTSLKAFDGFLKKRSKKGKWQKRYFFLNNSCLNYTNKKNGDKIRASIDIRKLKAQPMLVDRFGNFNLEFDNGAVYHLRAKSVEGAKQWIEMIETRRQYYQEISEDGLKQSEGDDSSSMSGVAILAEGKLMKKSPSRFKAWQPRFFRLTSEGMLYYYKSEKSSLQSFLGQIVVDGTCKVTKCAQDQLVFYLYTHFRVYVLQALNVEQLNRWIESIQRITEEKSKIEAPKNEETQPAEVRKILPLWMKEWDEKSNGDRFQELQKLLDVRFEPVQGNLLDTVNAATSLIEELEELAFECLDVHNRIDILETRLCICHVRLEHEIGFYLVGERLDTQSNHDMLRLMDLIIAYNDFINRISESESGKRITERLPPNTMLDHVDKMVTRYVLDLQDALGVWIDNIVKACIKRGCLGIENKNRSSSVIITTGPLDVFNMISETLTMAHASGLSKLEGAALSSCVVAIADYLSQMLSMIRASPNDLMKNLQYLCAITNDCGVVIDEIDKLEETYSTVAQEYEFCMDPLRVKYDKGAVSALEMIALMIKSDLDPLFNKLFQNKRGGTENVMAYITGTLKDYFDDLFKHLEEIFFRKLMKVVSKMVFAAYCNQLLNPSRALGDILLAKVQQKTHFWIIQPPTIKKISKQHIEQIKRDRSSLLECFGKKVLNSGSISALEKLFKPELAALDHIIDFLTVSPDFYPSSILNLCTKYSDSTELKGAVLATAESCLALRGDINKQTAQEIQSTYAETINDLSNEVKEGKKVDLKFKENAYQEIWPQWVTKPSLGSEETDNDKMLNEIINKRDETSSVESEECKVDEINEDVTDPSKQDLETPIKLLPNDISEEASKKRQNYRRRLSVEFSEGKSSEGTEETVEMHGYLEKKRPGSRPVVTWQRRWFLLHRVLDQEDGQWKIALTWHLNHNAKTRSRVFMCNVQAVDFLSQVPVSKKEDGTYVLEQDLRKQKGLYRKQYEFQIVSFSRTYLLRANSMSETIAWVNALTKAMLEAAQSTTAIAAGNLNQQMLSQYKNAMKEGSEALGAEDFDLAEAEFQQAVHLAQTLKAEDLEAQALKQLSTSYIKTDDKMLAGVLMLEMAAETFAKIEKFSEYENCILAVAEAQIQTKELQEAETFLKKHVEYSHGLGRHFCTFDTKLLLIQGQK